MEKIKFEDGQLVRPAYVTIDDVEHEVTPAVHEGSTPLSSYNLNKMQNEIIEDGIIVSQTEPEIDRRKIWIQKKGKNLFDGQYYVGYGYNTTTGKLVINNAVYSSVNKIELQTKATKICLSRDGELLTTRFFFYDNDNNFISHDVSSTESLASIPKNSKYCSFQVGNGIIASSDFSSVQVEAGTSEDILPTSFEAYTNNTIYVKNDNGIYEEFIKKEEDRINKVETKLNNTESKMNEKVSGVKLAWGKELKFNLQMAQQALVMMGHNTIVLCWYSRRRI